ncbi:hypothetical protein ACFL07_02310 [Pseudomonadota bacterium]
MYRVFDLVLQSELWLPDELGSSAEKADLLIHVCPDAAFDEYRFEWFHEWKSPDGGTMIAAAKFEDEYLLRFPGLADFHLSPSKSAIRVLPAGGVDESTLAHLLLDQVIPRWQSHRGHLVVHASSVELPSGVIVGFLGSSGSGKSTLASSFFASGARMVSDDCLMLELQNKVVYAVPPYSGLRLWEDSRNRLFPSKTGFETMAHYTSKQQMILQTGGVDGSVFSLPLKALFLLDRAEGPLAADDIYIEPEASGSFSAAALIESIFALDLSRGAEVQQNFQRVGEIVCSSLLVFRLSYPRSYGLLPRVREAINMVADGFSG